MTPRISASKPIVKELNRKINYAKQIGDLGTLRRGQGLQGVLSGAGYETIAAIVGVSTETIRLWVNAFLCGGVESLEVRKSPGRPCKLTKSQKKKLKQAITEGPEAAGYSSGCWNAPMVQDYIQKTFCIFYSAFYIAQLLRNLGMTYQKAAFASAHLDPEKRTKWLKKMWPKIKRLSKKCSSYLLFGDEASFPQWGSLSYTWAPKGHQPVVQTSGIRRGYKVFGLIDYWTGKFFYKAITGKFTAETYKSFLQETLTQTRRHLIVIQDGAKYHTSEEMQVFFYENRARLTVFQMPAYSPDYNPIENLWRKIKKKGVHLKYFPTFEHLKITVDELLAEFKTKPSDILKVFGFYTKQAKA